MTCPACGRHQPATRRFCSFCDAFLADPVYADRGSFVRRILAFLIDLAGWGLAFLAVFVAAIPSGGYDDGTGALILFALAAAIVVPQIRFFLRAQTIGKALFGLQVRHEGSGEPARLLRMAIREAISQTVSNVFGLGYVWALFDPDGQTLHDKLTNTVVVRRLKQPRALYDAATPGSLTAAVPQRAAPAASRVASPTSRPSLTLDGLLRAVPRRVIAGAVVLAVFVLVGMRVRDKAILSGQERISATRSRRWHRDSPRRRRRWRSSPRRSKAASCGRASPPAPTCAPRSTRRSPHTACSRASARPTAG